MSATTGVASVDRSDTQIYPDAQVFDDYRRRGEYAFVGETAPRRRALDFYLSLLGADGDTVRTLVRECTNKVAPVLSAASLVRLGLPRKLALSSIASVKKLRGVLPCQEWHAVVVGASQPDAMPSAARLRLKRAYVVSVQASVGAVANCIVPPFDFPECGNPISVYLLHLLAHAYFKLAVELLDKSRSRPHQAARYLHRALALARCLYGPMSPRISPLLSSWHDINHAIGPQRDPQVAWWHNSIVVDWFQRIQTRRPPFERDTRLTVGLAPWVEWGLAHASHSRRARIADRAQRRSARIWWRQTADLVVSHDDTMQFDWVALVAGRLFFYTERCRHASRLLPCLDTSLRNTEHARMKVLSRHPACVRPLVDVAAIDLRIARVRMIRGILGLRPSRRRARSAIGDLRASYHALWALARQPAGDAYFHVVFSLAAVTVALMEALHVLDARRQLAAVAVAAERLATLLAAHKYTTCDAWRARLLARVSASQWLARARTVTAPRREAFRKYTASVAVAVDASRRIDPRVAVGSFILESYAAQLAVFRRAESIVTSPG